MTPLRHLANQAVSSEYERLDGAEEGPGERRDDAGRFEVRTVAPSGLDGNASAEKRKAWLLRTYDLRSHLRKTRPKLAGEASFPGSLENPANFAAEISGEASQRNPAQARLRRPASPREDAACRNYWK